MIMKVLTIGIAERKIAKSPDRLATLGLGSCIGLVLYDPVNKIGGMVHIMLPTAPSGSDISNKAKFADTAITDLISSLVKLGANRNRLIAKFAGGAHMFKTAYTTDILNIGKRNIDMCRKVLADLAITIASEDIGGSCGRSIEFCCESNKLQIRTASPKAERMI